MFPVFQNLDDDMDINKSLESLIMQNFQQKKF
jgi:hypothetical protein